MTNFQTQNEEGEWENARLNPHKWESMMKCRVEVQTMQLENPFRVQTKEGIMEGKPGDYLVKGAHGELYPVDQVIYLDTFQTHEEAEAEEGWGPGDPKKAKKFDTILVGRGERKKEWDLVNGEQPWSRSDNSHYARDPDGGMWGFEGHRELWDIFIESSNYAKSNFSGEEIRRQVVAQFIYNGEVVYESRHRDPREALLEAAVKLDELRDHTHYPQDIKEGMKIWWKNCPVVIKRVLWSQGSIICEPAPGTLFAQAPYQDEDWPWDEFEDPFSVKLDVLQSDIWWYNGDRHPVLNRDDVSIPLLHYIFSQCITLENLPSGDSDGEELVILPRRDFMKMLSWEFEWVKPSEAKQLIAWWYEIKAIRFFEDSGQIEYVMFPDPDLNIWTGWAHKTGLTHPNPKSIIRFLVDQLDVPPGESSEEE